MHFPPRSSTLCAVNFGPRDLPFLIVHGALVWKLVLAAAVAGVAALAWAVRRRSQRRNAVPGRTWPVVVVAAGLAGGISRS